VNKKLLKNNNYIEKYDRSMPICTALILRIKTLINSDPFINSQILLSFIVVVHAVRSVVICIMQR